MAGCCATHQLPRDELKRFVKETPFTSREVLKLWSRYARLNKDHSGRLSLQVTCRILHLHVMTNRLAFRKLVKALSSYREDCARLTGEFRDLLHLLVSVLQEMLNVDEFKCNPFASRIVELFSEDGSGVISFQKFINIFSVFSPRATAETKTVWAFAVWDFDGACCTHGMRPAKGWTHSQHTARIVSA